MSPLLYFAVGVEKEGRALVGHNANLKEATGVWPKKEGDSHVFRPGAGGFVYIGDVTAEEWVRFSGATAAR